MVIFAHADDAEFTSGGAIAAWVAEGHEIIYVVCTDGSRGTDSAQAEAATLVRTRREEQLAAAKALGVAEVLFLKYRDGDLELVKDGLREQLICLIQERRPDRVVTWDPWRPYQLHRDHTAVGSAAFYASVEASASTFVKGPGNEAGQPHYVDDLYLFGTDRPDTWVDISPFVEKKREAIRCHRSQVARGSKVEERLLDWNRNLGQQYGVPHAEVFKVLRPHCEICR
jgi:LmbE family N-acetylglucosaminyl deacetylase